MSLANVEVVKQVIDGYNQRDLNDFDDLLTPDYEWFPALVRGVEGGSYRGREGVSGARPRSASARSRSQ